MCLGGGKPYSNHDTCLVCPTHRRGPRGRQSNSGIRICLENPFGIWFLAKSNNPQLMRVVRTLWDTGVYSSWVGCVFQVGRACISYFFIATTKHLIKASKERFERNFFLSSKFIYLFIGSQFEGGKATGV